MRWLGGRLGRYVDVVVRVFVFYLGVIGMYKCVFIYKVGGVIESFIVWFVGVSSWF